MREIDMFLRLVQNSQFRLFKAENGTLFHEFGLSYLLSFQLIQLFILSVYNKRSVKVDGIKKMLGSISFRSNVGAGKTQNIWLSAKIDEKLAF